MNILSDISSNIDRSSASMHPVVGQEKRGKFFWYFSFSVVVLSIGCGLITYAILTGLTPIRPTRNVNIWLMAINAILVALMFGIVFWQLVLLLRARAKKVVGSRLHIRIVSLFSIVAVLPAIIVAVFATVTLNRGLESLFSEGTRSIVNNAVVVAEAYINEHSKIVHSDLLTMAAALERSAETFRNDRQTFSELLNVHTKIRGLYAAYLVSGSGNIVVSATPGDVVDFFPLTINQMMQATSPIIVSSPGDNITRGLIRLKNLDDSYLYVYRFVAPQVLEHLRKTKEKREEFVGLEMQKYGVQVTFALMYIGVAFIFLLAAVWFGLWVADRIVQPIVKLMGAAKKVSDGELDVKVPVRKSEGDLAVLGLTFNKMVVQLNSQRTALVNVNHSLDERRRFTEAVLSGVTAGVIGVDNDGIITLVNRSASAMLGKDIEKMLNKEFIKVLPEMSPIFIVAQNKKSWIAEDQIGIVCRDQKRKFTVRVTTEQSDENEHGFVITFDDITELEAAQRKSAWSDIARRIAHEIKNPLTPIQLSAERLRRKYSKNITDDDNVFEKCIETIIRQVGDIGSMVDEFSSFARMPKACLEMTELGGIVKDALLLQRVGNENIEFSVDIPDEKIIALADRRLLTQAITNIVKNATEAIEARKEEANKEEDNKGYKGQIKVQIIRDFAKINIDVIDNGKGLPEYETESLLEPYMTTRDNGTGLGLAIVKKIMEEHGGNIELMNAKEQKGAVVRLSVPAYDA